MPQQEVGGGWQEGGRKPETRVKKRTGEEAWFGGDERRAGSAPVPLCHNWELRLEGGRLS